ncbi:MAG: ribosomal L7Ae/L30e/S12e/Gadd45 family protein [Clostridia bacterium]
MDKETKLISILNSSPKVVGSRQVLRGISEGIIRCVIIAEDADDNLKNKLVESANDKNIEVLFAPSMEWLGRTVKIKVPSATVGLNEFEA